MKKLFLGLSFVLFFLLTGNSQSNIYPDDSTSRLENSLLWEISGKNLTAPSFLFGTIHMVPKEYYFLPANTDSVFSLSKEIVFEIDMATMNDFGAQIAMISKVMLPNNQTLKDLLSKEDYATVNKAFSGKGLPMFLLERIKPIFLTSFLSEDFSMIGGGGENKMKSYEMEFMKMATAQQKPTDGLETIDFQMGIMDSIPYKVQAQMLVATIQDTTQGDNDMEKMYEAYKNQNLTALDKMINGDESEFAGYTTMLLDNRNKKWISRMRQKMAKQSTFFAVGAGHLGGKNGVINLLRRQGYTLRAIGISPKNR